MDFRKSSYSGSNGGNCVEVASAGNVMVRDSTDRDGLVLVLSTEAWQAFTRQVATR
jgi:hypothetical protein